MTSMYIYELKANAKSFVTWVLIMGVLVLIATAKFQGYYNNPEMLNVLEAMPKALLNMFSIQFFDLTTLKGFFGVLSRYTYLITGSVGMLWGSGVITKEELQKTADFTLTLPLSRRAILTAKSLATLTHLVLYVIVSGAIFLISASQFHPDAAFYRFLGLELVGMFFVGWIFWALGTCLACALRKPERSQSVGITAVLGLYILAAIQGMHPKLEWVQWITPFKYFDALRFYRGESLSSVYVILSLIIVGLFLACAYRSYNQRDVYT